MEVQENPQELDVSTLPCLHLISAFLAMEHPDVLISLARGCGGGFIGEMVQSFILNHCIGEAVRKGLCGGPYLKRFLKKLITEIESEKEVVLDALYEHYAFTTSLKDDDFSEGKSRVVKKISFLFPDECSELQSCLKSKKLEVSLQCSLNLLEGDTGCSIWPSSLFLSEFVLSFPEIFFNKSCLEVGSGVGLLGICLAHVKSSKVILSDGDLSTLENMRFNVDSNLWSSSIDGFEQNNGPNTVQCVHLPWESATENDLQTYAPDIVLGADVIYDPLYLPHLVRVLSILLKGGIPNPENKKTESYASICDERRSPASERVPVAYIASVIRNIETFNYFLEQTEQANLTVTDITEERKPFNLLPYAKSYQRSGIRIFIISYF